MKIIFYYFISVYSLIKSLLGIRKGSLKKRQFFVRYLVQICIIALTIITMLSTVLLLLPNEIFLLGMDLYMMWRLGENYGGRLTGQDAMHDSADEKVSISVVIILNHNDKIEVALKKVQGLVEQVHNSFYKLSCTVENHMGYAYYVRNQVTAEGSCIFVKVNEEEYLTREALMEYIQKKHMHYTINGKRLWYAKVFAQPILWNNKSKTNKQLGILLVFRHCLADGISLIGSLKNFMLREENPELFKLDPKYSATPNFSFDDAYVYRNPFIARKDERVFDIRQSERQMAFYDEDEIKYVPLIKKMKNKIGVGFTEILIAGLTASLAELLANRGKTMDVCTMGVIYRPINSDLVSIINGTYDYDSLSNDSTMVLIDSPVTMKDGSTMKDRVKAIGVEIEKVKYSVDGLLYYAAGGLGHLLPMPLLRYCVQFVNDLTGLATNTAGLKVGTVGGYEVETALPFISYYFRAGFRLAIFSKGDRLQLSLTIRENILHSRNEAQIVLNNVFKYIDQLSNEMENE